MITNKLRSETALTASASLPGLDGIGKMAQSLGLCAPAAARYRVCDGSLAETQGFEPWVPLRGTPL